MRAVRKGVPGGVLVAAHIKKQSQCTAEERLNAAVVMPACTFGCDALFENGYLAVDDRGLIEVSTLLPTTPAVTSMLSQIAGRPCPSFTAARADHFDWHREHTFKRGISRRARGD